MLTNHKLQKIETRLTNRHASFSNNCENEALIVVHVRGTRKLEPRVTFTFHSIASDSISIPFFFLFVSVALANSLFSYPFLAIFEEYKYRSRNEQCI